MATGLRVYLRVYCAATAFEAARPSSTSGSRRVFKEASMVVTEIFGHLAFNAMLAASGSNQKLNSCLGLLDHSGASVCGLMLPPFTTNSCASSANCESRLTARATLVRGPAA